MTKEELQDHCIYAALQVALQAEADSEEKFDINFRITLFFESWLLLDSIGAFDE